MKFHSKGFVALFFATFLYGLYGIFSRLLGSAFALFFQTWTRYLFVTLLILILILSKKLWKNIKIHDVKWFLARTLSGIVSIIGPFVAFNFLPIGTTYFIFYAASTIGGYTIGGYFFREKLTSLKIFSLLFAIVGLLLIYSVNIDPTKSFYIFLAFISGLAVAGWNTFSKKISSFYSNEQLVFVDSILSCIICICLSLIFHERWVIPTLNLIWGLNILFALTWLSTGILVVYGFKYLEAQIGSLVMLTEVIFGILFGFIFYKETIPTMTLLGGIIILTAIILPEIKQLLRKLN